jgi:hypothetical protein
LEGPWKVRFDPAWGGPAEVEFPRLIDWTESDEDGIRHYSGTATYHKRFNLSARPPTDRRLWLDLGAVKNIASVRLNGVDLGVVWTAPWRVDISRAVQVGENQLEIDVTNLWPNRLLRDQELPPEKRLTRTNIELPKEARPLPSGLHGPVSLLSSSL